MRKTLAVLLSVLIMAYAAGCKQSGTISDILSEVSSSASASTRQQTVDLLKNAQTLLNDGKYTDAISKAKEARTLYGSSKYTDNLNKTALNVILQAGRALGYQNRDYMRRNVFFSTDPETLSLNSKIRTFFNEYAAKNAFYRLPHYSGDKPDLQGLVFYAYAFYENPENNITDNQVEAVAEKFFGGFSQSHRSVQLFTYANGIYTPAATDWSSDTYCGLTKLSRRSEMGSAIYTAIFALYDYREGSKNRQYLDSLKTQKAYTGLAPEDILASLLAGEKTETLESSGTLTVEFEDSDNGVNLYFIIHSVQ